MNKKSESQVLLYRAPDGRTRLEVRLQDETVWLTQAQMAELFQTTVANVNIHLMNIFAEGELDKVSAIKECLITAADGKGREDGGLRTKDRGRKTRADGPRAGVDSGYL